MPSETKIALPLKVISSMATRHVLAQLSETYRQQSGQDVVIEAMGGVDVARCVEAGGAFDIVVLSSDALERLVESKSVDPVTLVDLARSSMAVAVKAGAPRPAIDSDGALREALIAASAIGYSTGPSGTHLMNMIRRWKISETLGMRMVQAPPGTPVASLIDQGKVELGFQQLSELIHQPGIDVLGALPAQSGSVTVFSGAVCVASVRAKAAEHFLAFLGSSLASEAKLAHGMDPV